MSETFRQNLCILSSRIVKDVLNAVKYLALNNCRIKDLNFFSYFPKVLIAIAGMWIYPSQPTLLIPIQRKPYLEIYCMFGYGTLAAGIYNAVLIVACCYYAFKARKVPSNFNESKFIAVSVYSTLIFCLAAIPLYTTANSVAQKIGVISVTLLVNIYVTLLCLYIPKLYAIHFASDEVNESSPVPGSQNITLGTILYEGRSNNLKVKDSPSTVVI